MWLSFFPAGKGWRIFAFSLLLVGYGSAQIAKGGDKAAKSTASPIAAVSGAIKDGHYRNTFFGFSYKLPFGWVDRTQDMSEEPDQPAPAGDVSAPRGKGQVLLAVFDRPPAAKGETVNSAAVLAAEPVAAYPGLKSAEQYFGPLTELTKSKGLTVVNPPYEFSVGTRQLVRGDFNKDIGPLQMHQSTLVMVDRGYVVSFTLIGGSADEVDGLVERLSFRAGK
jgi:hypothetical protein